MKNTFEDKNLREEFIDFVTQPKSSSEVLIFWLSKLSALKAEIKKEIEKQKVEEMHTTDCEYQRKGCDCGYMDRVVYNQALDDIMNLDILK